MYSEVVCQALDEIKSDIRGGKLPRDIASENLPELFLLKGCAESPDWKVILKDLEMFVAYLNYRPFNKDSISIKNTSKFKESDVWSMSEKERGKFNLLIGYCGPNEQLRHWATNQGEILGLPKFALPEECGGDVGIFRRLLWRDIQRHQINANLLSLLQSLRSKYFITLWFLNYRDVEMARLIRRFLVYCLESGLFE